MKIVMTFGAFDLVHPGHIYYLSEAKKHGDKLITIIARDSNIEKVKGKKPLYNENIRLLDIKNLGISDIVELGHETDVLNSIKKYKPDIIALGYDQTSFIYELSEYLKKNNIKTSVSIIGNYREDIYKSSKMKNNN